MRLHTSNRITFYCPVDCPTVAMLRPRSGSAQWVVAQAYDMAPWAAGTEYVDVYGNLCQRFTAPAGWSTITVESEVDVDEHAAFDPHAPCTPVAELPDDALIYLLPSRYCPSDRMCEQAENIVAGCKPGYAQVAAICTWVRKHIDYRYGVSDHSTDALQTLEDKAGVCRDFSHVAVSLCRALQIPARFVTGYLYELDPMDMHAWIEAFVGGRWYTFDATQKTLRAGRVVVAYGRDAADVAFLSNYAPMEISVMNVEVRLAQPGPVHIGALPEQATMDAAKPVPLKAARKPKGKRRLATAMGPELATARPDAVKRAVKPRSAKPRPAKAKPA
ncbi:MAG: lasso peptide biosynthesis protein [Bdellovibrionales bacterium]|nr:lasso peptide biosynthesis protein [Ramlibacter sp.]